MCGWCAGSAECLTGSSEGPSFSTCPSAWGYSSCPVSLCAGVSCGSYGLCSESTGECMCTGGYTGPDCSVPENCATFTSCDACTSTNTCGWCAGSGQCFTGTAAGPIADSCDFAWAWNSDQCSAATSLCAGINCGSHGACSPHTGYCMCAGGYTGSDCSVPEDCLSFTTCDTCMRTSACGWCADSGCFAGDITGPSSTICTSPWEWFSDQCAAPSSTADQSSSQAPNGSSRNNSSPDTSTGQSLSTGTVAATAGECPAGQSCSSAGQCIVPAGFYSIASCTCIDGINFVSQPDVTTCADCTVRCVGSSANSCSEQSGTTSGAHFSGITCTPTPSLCAGVSCGSHGVCLTNTGQCMCWGNYTSLDCSVAPVISAATTDCPSGQTCSNGICDLPASSPYVSSLSCTCNSTIQSGISSCSACQTRCASLGPYTTTTCQAGAIASASSEPTASGSVCGGSRPLFLSVQAVEVQLWSAFMCVGAPMFDQTFTVGTCVNAPQTINGVRSVIVSTRGIGTSRMGAQQSYAANMIVSACVRAVSTGVSL